MPTPGLLWVNSHITSPSLPDSTFNTWYNETHIRDILQTSQMRSAYRYKSIDPASATPYLALYPVSDVAWLGSKEFASIPTKDKVFANRGKGGGEGEEGECYECVAFDTRFYEHIHSYEKEGVQSGPAKLIISAALSPAPGTEANFDAWYREEHYSTLASCTGYIRTRRYKLKQALRPDAGKELPVFLALHEFEAESLPDKELAATAETEWAKRVMGGLVGSEVGVYRLLGAWGEVKAKF